MTCPHCGTEIPKELVEKEAASTIGRLGGSAKTEAKKKASAENGKLGGRPRKPKQ